MNKRLVMTVIGTDRPGLVESVAAVVADHEGNWLESRMSRLGGQFAGILRVEVPPAREKELVAALKQMGERGLTVVVQPDQVRQQAAVRMYVLEIVGQDRPGIVREISSALAAHNVNVEELETECVSAAMSGESLFKAHATLGVPREADLGAVRSKLEKIAEDLIVELQLVELK